MAAFSRVILLFLSLLLTVYAKSVPSLDEVTLEELIGGLESGMFSSVDLVDAYLARIKEVNTTLHCVTEVNPDAGTIAANLDAERSKGQVRGPLHGIPILIKNNIATKDQMNNTAGSFALLGAKAPRDSTVARKLRKAGAIILGKANLSQWANYRSSNSSNGWSAYGGQTEGVYYPKQDPSGSSSGSGVSSALGLALASLGSETDGSIVSPSERSSLAGIKPTVGLVSRALVIPISEHQDTVGPMARTVKDAAYLLQAIVGRDSHDNYTSAIPFPPGEFPDYVGSCNFSALRGARIGVPANVLQEYIPASEHNSPPLKAFRRAVSLLEKAGATIVREANFTQLEEFIRSDAEIKVLNADFLVDLANYISQLTENPTGVTDLASVARFTKNFKQEAYPSRDIAVWTQALNQGFNNTAPEFWKNRLEQLRLGGPGGLLGALRRHDLDAVVLPTNYASSFAAGIGSPIVTVPLGYYPANQPVSPNFRGNLVDTGPNVPYGLSFLGDRFSEATLIGLAYAFEQRTMARKEVKPYVRPNIDLVDILEIRGSDLTKQGD